MMTVNEVRRVTGVSIRTLQYYDKIGLLKASAYTPAGYRLYDGDALRKLQQILLYRELEFSLKDIKAMMQSPNYDRHRALCQQLELLQMKKKHIEGLITLARTLTEGIDTMGFHAFDKSRQADYARQAKASWDKTDAWREFEERGQGRTQGEEQALGDGLMTILAQFGQLQHRPADDAAVQHQVQVLQEYITAHFYRCTDTILAGLGQMYAAGGDFTASINAAGGEGTAEFAAEAIRFHCQNN